MKCKYCGKETKKEYCGIQCKKKVEEYTTFMDKYGKIYTACLYVPTLFMIVFNHPLYDVFVLVFISLLLMARPIVSPELINKIGLKKALYFGRVLGVALMSVASILGFYWFS